MTQLDIITQLAIDEAEANADFTWKLEAEATLMRLIKQDHDFTSEDVLRILEEKGVTTHEKRALGGLMQRLSKQGYIRFIRYTKATRDSRHGAPIALWRPVSRLVLK